MEKQRHAIKYLLALVTTLVLTGGGPSKSAYLGFLRDYSQLRASSEIMGARIYQHLNRGLAKYDKFLIDPIVVHFAPDAKATSIERGCLINAEYRIDGDQLILVCDRLHDVLARIAP